MPWCVCLCPLVQFKDSPLVITLSLTYQTHMASRKSEKCLVRIGDPGKEGGGVKDFTVR